MEYRDVQKIAKDTISYMKGKIEPGMNLKNHTTVFRDQSMDTRGKISIILIMVR